MPKKNAPMTERAIRALTKPEISVDGCNNLKLRSDSAGRRWVVTVPTCRACGKRHNFGLGSYPEVRVKEARERGNEIHRDNRAGICRKEQKAVLQQQQCEEASKRMT
ncbi:Arm DNA-binding domain-containing protein, partial [bacterium]|nr:Arm DNA-binding domain-containing protein [bacterium]